MASFEADVHLVGDSLHIDMDGMDAKRALLWATLLMDPRFSQRLHDNFIDRDPEIDADWYQPLSHEDMVTSVNEVALLEMHGKVLDNTGDGYATYEIPAARDMAAGASQKILEIAGFRPYEYGQLPYRIVNHDAANL